MIGNRKGLSRDGGFTFIEVTLTIVIVSIMVLGLTIILLAFREHLDRSWSVRVMDQYGNDVIERLTHELRNAVDVSIRSGIGNTHEINISYLEPNYLDRTYLIRWRADLRNCQITVNNDAVDPAFPPRKLSKGESFEILQFTLSKYGEITPDIEEHIDASLRNEMFLNATYDIRFKLRYNRDTLSPGQNDWSFEKSYSNRVYLRNMNLPIRRQLEAD
ncbi:type II secretion system protein [bacterium]|nr:type II secretion system protein [bacterium]